MRITSSRSGSILYPSPSPPTPGRIYLMPVCVAAGRLKTLHAKKSHLSYLIQKYHLRLIWATEKQSRKEWQSSSPIEFVIWPDSWPFRGRMHLIKCLVSLPPFTHRWLTTWVSTAQGLRAWTQESHADSTSKFTSWESPLSSLTLTLRQVELVNGHRVTGT